MRLTSGNASLRCDYCQSVVIAQADDSGMQLLDEVAELVCPVCSIPLWNATLAGVRIHACKQCHGQLLQIGFIEGLIDQLRAVHQEIAIPPPVNPDDLQRKMACPQCHQRMDSHYDFIGGHTVISGCERCQVNWLGGGALMLMVRAPREDLPGSC
ncbi:MAG: zf-TFIIB domain-containing protein [Terracidiphilus sp.]